MSRPSAIRRRQGSLPLSPRRQGEGSYSFSFLLTSWMASLPPRSLGKRKTLTSDTRWESWGPWLPPVPPLQYILGLDSFDFLARQLYTSMGVISLKFFLLGKMIYLCFVLSPQVSIESHTWFNPTGLQLAVSRRCGRVQRVKREREVWNKNNGNEVENLEEHCWFRSFYLTPGRSLWSSVCWKVTGGWLLRIHSSRNLVAKCAHRKRGQGGGGHGGPCWKVCSCPSLPLSDCWLLRLPMCPPSASLSHPGARATWTETLSRDNSLHLQAAVSSILSQQWESD